MLVSEGTKTRLSGQDNKKQLLDEAEPEHDIMNYQKRGFDNS